MFFQHHDIIKKEVKAAINWAAGEYSYLIKLLQKLEHINGSSESLNAFKQAKHFLLFVNLSERRLENHLNRLKKAVKDYPSLRVLEEDIEVPENELLKAFSLYDGEFKNELEALHGIIKRKWKLKLLGQTATIEDAQKRISKIVAGLVDQVKVLVRWTGALEKTLLDFKKEEEKMSLDSLESRRAFLRKSLVAGVATIFAKELLKPNSAQAMPRNSSFQRLQSSSSIKILKRDTCFGKPLLCNLIIKASQYIDEKYGSSSLIVKDISKTLGGPLPPHKSHQHGIDVDLGIYIYTNNTYKNIFWHLAKDHFNDNTWQINWDFIKILQQYAPLSYIFLDKAYIKGIKIYVENSAPGEWDKYGKLLRHAGGHKDHFHIRVQT
ncbi:penicillin-insensitive murein endopeptidase [Candidatus Woesearchaeota archaeon]|nr:penicillin-insensitive murein endopeptidase [Candidatus Woesearchaeota archaeon]